MKTVVVVAGETMGRGSDELGRTLMANCLRKMWASPRKPDAVVFYNGGVKVLAAGSPALDAVTGLASAGVDLVACGTCVTYFELGPSLVAGRVSDMQEIVALMQGAESIITL